MKNKTTWQLIAFPNKNVFKSSLALRFNNSLKSFKLTIITIQISFCAHELAPTLFQSENKLRMKQVRCCLYN